MSTTKPRSELRRALLSRTVYRIALAVFLFVLFVLLVLPLIAILIGSFRTGTPLAPTAEWTLENYRQLWALMIDSGSLLNSILLGFASAIGTLILGGSLAFIVERTDARLGRRVTPLMVLTFLIFPMLVAMGYDMLTDDYIGAINQTLRQLTGDQQLTLTSSSGWAALIFVSVLLGSHGVFFLLRGTFGRTNQSLEEASLVAGRGAVQTFLRVTLPLVSPVLITVGVLGFISAFQAFTVPYILDSDHEFLLTQVVRIAQANESYDYGVATALGAVTLAVVTVLVLIQRGVLGSGRSFELVGARTATHRLITLGRSRPLVDGFIVLYFVASIIIPVVTIVISSFTVYPGIYTSFTTRAYERVFANTAILDTAATSITIAVVASLLAVIVSFAIAVLRVRGTSRWIGFALAALVVIALGTPGVVQAVGINWAYVSVPGLQKLYRTQWLVMIALIAIPLPFLNQVLTGALRNISRDLEDAAVVSGTRRVFAFARITVPLLAPTLLGVWFISAVAAFGAIEIPLLIGPVPNPSLIQVIYNGFNSGDKSYAAALATLFLAVVTLVGALILLVQRLTKARLGPLGTLSSGLAQQEGVR